MKAIEDENLWLRRMYADLIKRNDLLSGLTDAKNLEIWSVLFAFAQCERSSLEPQACLPHLLQYGVEPAD